MQGNASQPRLLDGQTAGSSPSEVLIAFWFWQAVIPESGGVFGPWVVRHVVGCRPMATAMALWFWQAVIPESGGVLGP